MNYFKLKFLLLFFALAVAIPPAWAGEESVTFSEQGYTNQEVITSYEGANFSISFDKGTNKNAPTYYSTGTAIRLYGGNTMTVTSENDITKIELSFASGEGTNAITTDVVTYSDGTWTGSSKSVKFTVGGTSGHRRLAGVKVTYTEGGDTPPAEENIYQKVTNASQLVADKTYIIVNESANVGMGAVDDNRYGTVVTGLEFADGKVNIGGTEVTELTLGGKKDAWTFMLPNSQYLAKGNNDNKFLLATSPTTNISKWKIDLSNGCSIINNDNSDESYRYIRYENNRFDISYESNVALYVKYEGGETPVKQDLTTFAFSSATASATLGQAFTAPTLTVNPTVDVTYSSSDPDVATVANNGDVTLVGAGTTTITASFAGNDAYNAATAYYTLTVNAAQPTGLITDFYESFDQTNGTGGNDGSWSGNNIASSNITTDNQEWTLVKGGGAKNCIKLGTSSALGSAETPEISVNPGITYTLTFKAGAWSGDQTTLKLSATGGDLGATSVTMTSADWQAYSITFTATDETARIKFEGVQASKARFFLDEVRLTHDQNATPVTVVAKPEFSVAGGSYTEAQTVTITCATDGATIYYTIDGTDPTEESTPYTGAISISETTTLKAIAVKDGQSSAVAEATYTIKTVTSVANLQEANDLTDGTEFIYTGEAVVVWRDGSQMWLQDPNAKEGGALVYGNVVSSFSSKDKLKSGWTAKKGTYNNASQFTEFSAEKDGNQDASPFERTSISADNVHEYVLLKGVSISDDKTSLTFPGENGSTLTVYDKFKKLPSTINATSTYDIDGIIVLYGGNAEIYPLGCEEHTAAVVEVKAPEFTYNNEAITGSSVEVNANDKITITSEEGTTLIYTTDGSNPSESTTALQTDGNTAEVTITEACTIKAVALDGDANESEVVTLAVTISEPVQPGEERIYQKVTSTDQVTTGKYLIVYENYNIAFDGSRETLDGANNIVEVTITDGEIKTDKDIYFTYDATAKTLKSASNKYIGQSSYANGLKQDEDATKYTNSITIDNGNAVITALQSGNNSNLFTTLRFNTNDTDYRFRYYKSGQQAIQLYKEVTGEPVVPELAVTLPEVPAENYTVGQEVKVKATVENGSENTKLTYSAKVGEETITLVADAETDNVTLPNKKSGNVEVTVTATDGDRTATDTKTYVFDRAPKIKINYTFDPEGLNYEKDQFVTLTVSTEGHFGEPTITYNVTKIVNGSTQPVVASTAYNGLITLPTNEVGDYRVTITASDEYDHVLEGNQNISTISPTYKVYSAINTIDEAQAGETIKFNGEAVVAYHYKDSQFENMWIRDAEDNSGLIKYQNFGSAKFAQRDKLAEGWTATYGMANSLSYFSDASNLNADGQVEKVEPYALTTITADDVNKYASLSEIKITKEESGYYYFTVGDQEYRLAKKYCADAPEVGKYYNVVGVVTRNNDDIWMDLISIEEVNPVAIAGPTFCPAGGTYTEPKEVAIACATPGMKVMYKIGEGETWTEYTKPFKVSESCTVYAMGTMGNRTVYTDSEVTSATYTINALPAASITDGYYYLQSKAAETSGKWANVAGRRTLNFVDNADQQAGTVFRVMTDPDSIGQIETLRSQGADMQGYAKRAMAYVGPFIELVLDKIAGSTLGDPEAAGGILGENGVELILKKFTENFDYHLYVEGDATNGYRIYGRTPSMQNVVDFYHDNTDKVEEKLPMLEDYINQVIAKVNGKVQSANLEFPAYSLKTVRDRIAEKYGITLIDPEADMMGFYRQVLNNKEYVWDFAYQTAMIYLDAIKSSDAYKDIPNEYKAYVEKMEKVRPDTKYYIIERSNEPDYISENNVEINDARSFWTLEERPNFTVNFPAENKYGSKLVTTLYTDFAYDVPEGVTAYKVTAIDNGIATLADLGKNVPAQTPVLLMTEAAAKAEAVTKAVTLNTTDGTRPTDNKLEGPDYLIKKYEITSPTVELLFNVAEGIVGSEMMADYQYLKLRTSGTVNNRYFWGLSADDLKKCTEENSNGKLDCVVRALGVDEEGQNIGFYRNREAMAANQAFIPNIEFNPILLEVVATPTFAPEAGTYNEAQNVTIACETEGATIYYKTGDAEDWTEYDPEQPIRVEATTTIQAYAAKDGLGDSEIAEATYTIELPAEAPTFDPVPGSYTEAQQVTIIAPEGATVTYRIDGGEWQTYTEGEKIQVEATQTIEAKVEMEGMSESAVATGYYVIDIPEALPTDMPTFDGYYSVLNSGKYANIQGRKTLTFTDAPDAQAGTVIRLKSDNTGKVEVLRSQAADLQRYAYRAMDYVPDIVQIVVDKLGAEGEGHILGKDGLDAIMTKFDESFKPDLYIEKAGDNGYRIYGRTPSMQPVVDFYRENKDKVEAKLPDLVAFINSALAKLRNKANQAGMDGDNVFVDFDLKTIWTRMGGNLTDPEVDEMGFYRDVLNYKDNVWNFAYQTATFYLEKIKNTGTYTSLSEQLGEFAQYLDKIDQIHPDFKYYIVANEEVTKPDFISQGNADIINNAARTIWTLEPRTDFTVNFPEANKHNGEYVTTLYTDFAYTLPEGVTAWAVTSVSDQGIGELTAIDGTTIAAQTPVLLKSTTAGDVATFGITTADGTAAPEGNLLVGPDYLIETYQIKTPEVVKMFEAIKTVLGENIYNDLVDKYGHLQFRTSGTVNNKYFWGLNEEEVKSCAEENPETGKKVKVVRSLGIKDDLLGFNDNEHVYTNKALLVSTEHSAINFSLRGDINKDGVISIIDVTALIDILLDLPARNYLEPTTSYPKGLDYEAANVNENEEGIEITDVTTLIDILLNMPDQPAQGSGN